MNFLIHSYTDDGTMTVSIDGEKSEVRKLPYNFHARALEICFNLELPKGDHTIALKWLNPVEELELPVSRCIVFSDELVINR